MRLQITHSGDKRGFLAGYAARIILNDEDVSQYVSNVVLTVDADGPIRADVTFYLTGVDCDVPAIIEPMLGQAARDVELPIAR